MDTLEKAQEFIPIKMLKAIPDPERTTTEADIEAQLQEALVSTIAAIDPSLDDSFCVTVAKETTEAIEDLIATQADYIPLDADDDADTGLF